MGSEREIEKQFSENLDRLLAGEELKPDQIADEEMRSALEFARKMAELRATPTESYQARLKACLLQKLEEQEAKAQEKRGWLWNLAHQPVWQAVTAALFVIILGGIMWGAGLLRLSGPAAVPAPLPAPVPAPAPAPRPAPVPRPGTLFSVDASTNKTIYQSGEAVKIDLVMRNVSAQPLKIEKLPPILSLMQESTRQPVYTFAAGNETLTLAPNQVASFSMTWNQMDYQGRLLTGSYYVELEDLEIQGRAIQLNLDRPARFTIIPSPRSSGSTTFDLNQSQTVNDITVTLTKVVLTDSGVTLYTFISRPPDYTLVPGSSRPDRDYQASAAAYAADSNWLKEARAFSVEYLDSGMNQMWYIDEAIPAEARDVFFMVNNIGSWRGSWQFSIPLTNPLISKTNHK